MPREVGISFVASGNINPATFVQMATGGVMNTVSVCSSGGLPIGISQEAQKYPPGNIFGNQNPGMAAQTNDELLVYTVGDECLLQASSAGFSQGNFLQCDSNGYGQPVAAGSSLNYGAIALETVVAGAWGRVLISLGKA